MDEVVLDIEEFLERVQDDKELLFELFEIFIEDFEEKRALLTTAAAEKDYEKVRGIAHSIKGASGNISAKAVRVISMTLEDMGKESCLDGIEEILTKLDKAFEALVIRIEEVKKELGT